MDDVPDDDRPPRRPWTGTTAASTSRLSDVPPPNATARSAPREGVRAAVDLALVVSSRGAFEGDVCALVEGAGYRAEGATTRQPAWMTFARINPSVVICDVADAHGLAKPFAIEAMIRSVPVLLLRPRDEGDDGEPELVAPGVHCVTTPGDAPALRTLLHALAASGARPDEGEPLDAAAAERAYADGLRRTARARDA